VKLYLTASDIQHPFPLISSEGLSA